MILKALVEMPPSIEGAIDACFAGKRTFYVHTYFLMLVSHYKTSLINRFMLRKCGNGCQYNNSWLPGQNLSGEGKVERVLITSMLIPTPMFCLSPRCAGQAKAVIDYTAISWWPDNTGMLFLFCSPSTYKSNRFRQLACFIQ
jgi:hypothetical protein